MSQNKHDLGVAEAQRKLDALNRLVEISLVMNSTLELPPLLAEIMQSATEITAAEAASILLMDRYTHELRFAASTGSNTEHLMGIIVPMDSSIAGAIVREGKATIIDDVSNDPRHFRQVDEKIDFQTQSILGVPMRIKDNLVGVIEVLNKQVGRFDDDDLLHITVLASQAAVAIENARLILALTKANDDLSKQDKVKTDFIAIASHELRTPLSIILGYATFLQEEAQGEASDHAQMVLQSAMHLRNLIEDMTNLRFVQTSEGEIVVTDCSLNEILTQAYADVKSVADAKEQNLSLTALDTPVMVRADKLKAELAITNVLNNAVKFTADHGKISVSIEDRNTEIWVKITDNGDGLATDQLERIFDQFYQVEDHLTRRVGGMGLGLSIARGMIKQQGGRLWAESPGPGKGSTFTFAFGKAGN